MSPREMVRRPGQWWVLHTRSRQEKKVAETLARHDTPCYLPVRASRRRYAKSVANFEVPLFPCYVFMWGETPACDAALRTNRVAHVLPVTDQERLTHELVQIDTALTSASVVNVYPQIRVGQRYRVTRGPLKDIEGVAVRQGRHFEVCLDVTMLGQSAAVEVDAALLVRVD
jgi:transcription antitermination factor NusG